jgi:hypothetical protein
MASKLPSAEDFIISLGKQSAIIQGMEDVEDVDTAKVITRCSYVPPANSVEDGTTASESAGMLCSVMKMLLGQPWRSWIANLIHQEKLWT